MRRRGISELLSTLVAIAITLVAGAAVFGYVNGQSSASSAAVGNNVAGNINLLNEREVIVYARVANSTGADFWVYNSGLISQLTIKSVLVFALPALTPVTCTSWTMPTVLQYNVARFSTKTCTSNFVSGTSYTFEVVGKFGSTAQITVKF